MARKLVLPGDIAKRPQSLTLLVPRGYETGTRMVGVCHFCGAEFHRRGEEAAWQRHTVECGRKHLDDIRAMAPSERLKGTVFDPNTWDPEVEAHLEEVGRRMIREGRMELKPNERAGFS